MNASALSSLVVAGVLLSTGVCAAQAGPGNSEPGERVLRWAAGFARERDEDSLREVFTFEESRTASEQVVTQAKAAGPAPSRTLSTSNDIWIYDAWTEIFFDADGDGYHRYLRVRFDADSFYEEVYVYAKLFLSADGEFWELYHVTDDFVIQGSSAFDEYEVETELVSGYPPGLYDVLVELYDADFGDFVDEFGPLESSDFSLLPLEDLDHDGVLPSPVVISHEHGGGGAASWPMLAALLAGVLWRRRGLRFLPAAPPGAILSRDERSTRLVTPP